MSVIAHWIEQRGINTVVIGLVRKHLELIKPPRALWVPFELGRPIGAPSNGAFQQRVLKAALDMISTPITTATIVDFTEDDPRSQADNQWQPPTTDRFTSVADEVTAMAAQHQRFNRKYDRSAVGVAGIEITDSALFVDEMRRSQPTHSPLPDISPLRMARYTVDDLKSYYTEAALANGTPCSRQIHDWFWQSTLLGSELLRLRKEWMNSDNDKLKRLGERFLVPHRWRSQV